MNCSIKSGFWFHLNYANIPVSYIQDTDKVYLMEYIVHGSKNQIDSSFFTLERFL